MSAALAFLLSPLGRWLAGLLALLAAVLALWLYVGHLKHEAAVARSLAASEAQEIAGLQASAKRTAASQAINDKTETGAVAAQVQIHTVTKTIIQKVPVYVTPEADARCILPAGFVRVFNAAANGSDPDAVPAPPGVADSAPSGIECSAVAAVIAEDFGKYRAVSDQLNRHIDWDEAQEALAPAR